MPEPLPITVPDAIQQITLATNIKLWMDNMGENMPLIRGGLDLRDLAEAKKGKPALIVGAGPSVYSKHLDLLRKRGFDGIIVATDAILKPLIAKGINADYVVSVDGSPIIADFYPAVKLPTTACLSATVHPNVVKNLVNTQIFWFIPILDNPFESWTSISRVMHYLSKEKFLLQCPANVGATAWNLAAFLGCEPLVLIGFDHAYKADTPIGQTTYYDAFLRLVEGDKTAVQGFFRRDKNPFGQPYLSDFVWDFYKETFLKFAKARQGKTINATGFGPLYGEGITAMTFEEVLFYYGKKV